MRNKPKKIPVSIGIQVQGDKNDILKTLNSIKKQKLDSVIIKKIFISLTEDANSLHKVISRYAQGDRRITIIPQKKNTSSNSPINQLIKKAPTNILIIMNDDLRLHTRAIEEISLPFQQADVGIVGGRPIPIINSQNNLLNKQMELLWGLHHAVSLIKPKCGEIIAFRKIVRSLSYDSSLTESTLEVIFRMVGYKVVYAPRSIAYKQIPQTFKQYLEQRRKVSLSHAIVEKKYNYTLATRNTHIILAVLQKLIIKKPQAIMPLFTLLVSEIVARLIATTDTLTNHK